MNKVLNGQLVVKCRMTKAPIVQVLFGEKCFNVGRGNLSSELEAALKNNAESLNKISVDFEFVGGQPHRIRGSGIKPDPENVAQKIIVPSRSKLFPQTPEQDNQKLELGVIKCFSADFGFIEPDSAMLKELYFSKRELISQGWIPEEGCAVTYIRASGGKGPVALKVAPLYKCSDQKLIEECGASLVPAYWKPVVDKYLPKLSPVQQYTWLRARKQLGHLPNGLWSFVAPEVLQHSDMLGLLSGNVLERALNDACQQLRTMNAEQQGSWLRERLHYVKSIPSAVWDAFYPEVLQHISFQKALPVDILLRSLNADSDRLHAMLRAMTAVGQREWLKERAQLISLMSPLIWEAVEEKVVWEKDFWNTAPAEARLRAFTAQIDHVSELEILGRLDENLVRQTSSVVIDKLIDKVLGSTEPEVAFNRLTRIFLNKHAELLKSRFRVSMVNSLSLIASVAVYPEIMTLLTSVIPPGQSLLNVLQPYARFASRKRDKLDGDWQFKNLEPEDLILAAYYCSPEFDMLFDKLHTREDWIWGNLFTHIQSNVREGNVDNRDWSSFLVKGLQPRIAELAFAEVHPVLNPVGNVLLKDLNRLALTKLTHWTLKGVRKAFECQKALVSEDWEDNICRYDVKSNLYYRSRERNIGLRGFLINIDAERMYGKGNVWLPGIVISATSDDDCHWNFIGTLNPSTVPTSGGTNQLRRVSAFYFTAPSSCRLHDSQTRNDTYAVTLSKHLNALRRHIVKSGDTEPSCNPLVPLLFSDDQKCLDHLSVPQVLLIKAIFQAKRQFRSRSTETIPLERIIWIAINHIVFDARSEGVGHDAVAEALKEARELCLDKWFPVELPQIESRPLLDRWIETVLGPLNDHWHLIKCPNCGRQGEGINIKPRTSSAESSFWGEFRCRCGFDYGAAEITLFTHCHKCSCFPLVIGQNAVCPKCHGLRCHSEKDGHSCNACKQSCDRIDGDPTRDKRSLSALPEDTRYPTG